MYIWSGKIAEPGSFVEILHLYKVKQNKQAGFKKCYKSKLCKKYLFEQWDWQV